MEPMGHECANHPLVIWGSCFLWLVSMFAITWSLALFFCVGDILFMTGTDLVNSLMLLSGFIMLPTNLHLLCAIAQGRRIDYKMRVVCCPIWLCILSSIIINIVGAILCVHRMKCNKQTTDQSLKDAMKFYRSIQRHKHFIDNLQWTMKCCGLNSYKDWFSHNWYDITRDYEWDPRDRKRNSMGKMSPVTDSVPLSCCKSGSCISNYLSELGTYSINTNGCSKVINRIILISMIGHLLLFCFVVLVQVMILRYIAKKPTEAVGRGQSSSQYNVKHLMKVNNEFAESSDSNAESYDVESEGREPKQTSSYQMRTTYID